MKLNIPITISIACQSVSLASIIITFILDNWIVVKSSNVRYGMWRGCNVTECYYWYSNGQQILNYQLTDSYKAFQGLQSCMLGLIFITLVSLFLNLKICSKLLTIFIIDAILIFLATCCGLVSLIVFGASVYEPEKHRLDACFWLSVVASVFILLGLIMLIAFSISIELKSSRSKANLKNELPKVYFENVQDAPVKEQGNNNLVPKSQVKTAPNKDIQDKVVDQNPIQYPREANFVSDGKPSPRFQKNTPSQTESRLKNRIDAKNLEEEKKNNEQLKDTKPNRNYWNNKNKAKRYRYHHEHYDEKKPSQEQYKPGYSSEPDMIEYSLDRSWVSASNNLNTSMPILDDESNGLTGTFNSRHFVKLPKLIYYDGSNHYTRANTKN